MPKQKGLSGKETVSFFQSLGFSVVDQHRSHIKLRRFVSLTKETLIVPNHKSISKGTAKEICSQATNYVDEKTLRPFFYAK